MSNRQPSRSTVREMPPTTESASSTVGVIPCRTASSYAAVSPAGPAPMITTRGVGVWAWLIVAFLAVDRPVRRWATAHRSWVGSDVARRCPGPGEPSVVVQDRAGGAGPTEDRAERARERDGEPLVPLRAGIGLHSDVHRPRGLARRDRQDAGPCGEVARRRRRSGGGVVRD